MNQEINLQNSSASTGWRALLASFFGIKKKDPAPNPSRHKKNFPVSFGSYEGFFLEILEARLGHLFSSNHPVPVTTQVYGREKALEVMGVLMQEGRWFLMRPGFHATYEIIAEASFCLPKPVGLSNEGEPISEAAWMNSLEEERRKSAALKGEVLGVVYVDAHDPNPNSFDYFHHGRTPSEALKMMEEASVSR